jgi:hypothetical protein
VVLDVCSLRHLARSYGQKAETIDNRSVLRKFNQSISLDKVTTVHAYSKVGITRHLERCKCTKTSVRERADTTFTLRYKSLVPSIAVHIRFLSARYLSFSPPHALDLPHAFEAGVRAEDLDRDNSWVEH